VTNLKKTLIKSAGLTALALVATTGMASAAPVINVLGVYDNGTATGAAPFTLLNLGTGSANQFQSNATFSTGGETISFSGGSGLTNGSGVYTGNSNPGGRFSSPFGDSNSRSKYLVAGAENDDGHGAGTVTITFATAQTTLNLLWGSVDFSGQNTLSIALDGFTITGQDINNASSLIHNSDSGDDDVYVSITNLSPFTTVTFSDLSENNAFEFVPGAPVTTTTPVPEPVTMTMFAAGLAGMATIRRRRKLAMA
jgi:hypothetical protein